MFSASGQLQRLEVNGLPLPGTTYCGLLCSVSGDVVVLLKILFARFFDVTPRADPVTWCRCAPRRPRA